VDNGLLGGSARLGEDEGADHGLQVVGQLRRYAERLTTHHDSRQEGVGVVSRNTNGTP
jgi:hypothetical protein